VIEKLLQVIEKLRGQIRNANLRGGDSGNLLATTVV
jgi:hypothetical protein